METAKDICIGKIRDLRNQNQIKPREPLAVQVQASDSARALFATEGLQEMVTKLAVLSELTFSETEPTNAKSFISGTEKYYVAWNQEIDTEAERKKMTEELEYQRGFVKSVQAKASPMSDLWAAHRLKSWRLSAKNLLTVWPGYLFGRKPG